MRMRSVVGSIFYECIAKHMPTSFAFVNIGQKPFRAWCARQIAASIGKNVNIEKGTVFYSKLTLGDHAIIGAGSVVTKDIPPRAIAAGNPATVKKYRK